jgi:hypothetical protein
VCTIIWCIDWKLTSRKMLVHRLDDSHWNNRRWLFPASAESKGFIHVNLWRTHKILAQPFEKAQVSLRSPQTSGSIFFSYLSNSFLSYLSTFYFLVVFSFKILLLMVTEACGCVFSKHWRCYLLRFQHRSLVALSKKFQLTRYCISSSTTVGTMSRKVQLTIRSF